MPSGMRVEGNDPSKGTETREIGTYSPLMNAASSATQAGAGQVVEGSRRNPFRRCHSGHGEKREAARKHYRNFVSMNGDV